MSKFGFDQEALMGQFAEASARQGEALRKSVQEATLKALQGRELTLKNIQAAVKQVSQAAAQGAGQNPLGADKMEPLLAKAVAGMDAALLQVVEANRRALQQLVDYGAGVRETQVKKACRTWRRWRTCSSAPCARRWAMVPIQCNPPGPMCWTRCS
jgi:hypothetical protein